MKPFRMSEGAALQSRVERLKREEQDLAERVARQRTGLDAADKWHKSDPLYQRLSFVLDGIRQDLSNAQKELERQTTAPAARQHGLREADAQHSQHWQPFWRRFARFLRPQWQTASDRLEYHANT